MEPVQLITPTPITQQTAGGRSVAAGAGGNTNVALTNVSATNFDRSLMSGLIMVCVAAPTANGTITILDASGGNVIFNFDASTTFAIGQTFNFRFDGAPLRGAAPVGSAPGAAFHVTLPANTGTWRFFIDGYYAQNNSLQ